MGLGARLALVFAAVAATTALLVGGASYVTTDRQVTNDIDDFLEQRAEEITGGERGQPDGRRDDRGRDDDGRDDVIRQVADDDAEVQILDKQGTIASDTGLALPISSSDIELAAGEGRATLRTVTIEGVEYRMYTGSIDGGGAVQVARSLDESINLLRVLQTRLLVVAGALAIAAGGVGWVLAQRTTKPLRALTGAVDQVAETQDFATPVAVSGHDEVGRLARGFNRMLAALETSRDQQHRLVQDAGHELRTPLTSITANVDWLMRAPDLDPEARADTLQSVRRELTELNDVIAEIIELATDARESPELEPVDVGAIVAGAVEQFELRSGRAVQATIEPLRILGDADSLARAVGNLLSNADKYSPPGSPIAVEVGGSGVFVDDAGPGIPSSERALVFDRFYRRDEDRSKPGSGLGLSIVASIVEQHHGQVFVADSALGGARVGFRVPSI